MYVYGFLALAGFALASPCRPETYSSAGIEGDGTKWKAWSPSSASAPVQGDHSATSTKGWLPSVAFPSHSTASSAGHQTWSVPQADPSAIVFPLHKRPNPNSLPLHTPTGWGDWNYPPGSSSSTKSASGSKWPTSSETSTTSASNSGPSKTSYLSSTKSSSSTSKATSTSSSAYTTSPKSTSTTVSTLSTLTSKGPTSSSSSVSSTTSSSVSTSVLTLSTVSSSSSSSSTVPSTTSSSVGAFATNLVNPQANTLFTLDVTIGDTTYELQVDTGSSDTWAAANAAPAGFTPIPNEYLYIAYQDGTYALGPLGNDAVTLAGLTVPEQTVSIVDQTTVTTATDTDYVGIIGLSFNNLTSEFLGPEPAAADRILPYPGGQAHYSSIMNTIFNIDNLTPDVFSLALSRDPDEVATADQYGGVFVIGGQPDLNDPTINVTTPIVSTPMIDFNVSYLINVDSVTYGSQVLDQGAQYLVDSGTTLNYAPDASVTAYWNQFNPRPDANGNVACNTPIPPYAITIAGQTFTVNPADILLPNGDGTCVIGIQPSGGGTNVLGDVFMLNVLAVFDWATEQIRFGGREFYSVPA